MDLLQADSDSLIVQMSVRDFYDILSAFSAIRQSYNSVDPAILDMEKPRVAELSNILSGLEKKIPLPNQDTPKLRALP